MGRSSGGGGRSTISRLARLKTGNSISFKTATDGRLSLTRSQSGNFVLSNSSGKSRTLNLTMANLALSQAVS